MSSRWFNLKSDFQSSKYFHGLSALSLLLFVFSLSGGLAQQVEQALTLDVVVNSLQKGLSPRRAAALVKERGVNFQLTKGQEERLRAAGADDQLIADIRKAGEEYARRTKAEEERKTLEEERRKVEEERRKIEETRKKAEEIARRVEEERRIKFEEEKRGAEEERRAKAGEERKKLEEERVKLAEERKKVEEIAREADEEKKRAEELAKKQADDVKEGRVAPVYYKEGDFWHFRAVESSFTTTPTPSVHGDYEVVFSGGRLQVFKLTGNQRQGVLGGEAGSIRRLLGRTRDDFELLRFPLFVGQGWSNSYLTVQGALRNVENHVATVEKVTTPAGTFQAFKIERRDEAAEKGNPAVLTYFFSPETGSLVKYTFQSLSPRGPGGKREIELIKFGSGR
ncbi:MAG: hypothetical protein HYY45_12500 [Deltaproteobacteria bacterium]|nr:hypothetical protein [Deltaproteobacteria bacterium]